MASILLATAAFVCLFTAALAAREPAAVFSDSWALALYAYLAGTALYARQWGVEPTPALWQRSGAEPETSP